MTRGGRALARYGLRDTDSVRADLATIGLVGLPADTAPQRRELPDDLRQAILLGVSRAGRPELAARQLARLATSIRRAVPASDGAGQTESATDAATPLWTALAADPVLRARLIGLFGASEPLGDHLSTHATAWHALMDGAAFERATSSQVCAAALAAAVRDAGGNLLPIHRAIAPMRLAYRTRLAVIAAADVAPAIEPGLAGPTVSEVGEALAALADAVLASALELAEAAHPAPAGSDGAAVRLAVIAMGKCGACELNYVSDVDVLFVAAGADGVLTARPTGADGATAGAADGEPRQVAAAAEVAMVRLATARATELMQICRKVAWEVDAALRPEGTAGPLVRTLGGYQAYYQRWAKTWEFQALLKARPAAGDPGLGAAFLQLVRPQVWAAAERADFVTDIQAMRRRVRDAVPVPDRDRELKLSAGGLRDVEFAVQLLQMVHGRADETLRAASTLDALAALTTGGYVGRADGAALADAYSFERRIEHLLQLQHLLRTHSLPTADGDVEWLARTAGYSAADDVAGPVGADGSGAASNGSDPDGAFGGTAGGAADRLAEELARHEAAVRRLHEKLFYRPLLTAVAAVPTDELRLTERAAATRLAALGFAAPDGALRHIAALTDGVSRRAAIQRALLPVLLGMFADAPDPDAGLLGYRTVSDALAETPWYLRLLRDEGVVAQRLAQLLGTSRLVADLLPRAPEVLRLLADGADLAPTDSAAAAVSAASALAARAGRAHTDLQAAAAARSARRHEMLRLACADLLGVVAAADVAAGLTSIADAAVRVALGAAHRTISTGRGGLAARVAVIAMGRFGGAEMGYSSDADVLFVAGPVAPGVPQHQVLADATAVAELTTRLLGRPSPDPALNVDADLRPEGRSGPLVRTVESYAEYWRRHMAPWERQALLRARPIAVAVASGADDDELAQDFLAAVDPVRYPTDGLLPADAREIRRIKARVDTERLPRGADPTLHTKLGRGGLADVEWTVQLLQLRHAHGVPGLRQTGTLGAIRAAVDAGLIEAATGEALAEGWAAASRARNAIMLVTGRPGDEIPPHGRALAGIARACGYPADVDPGTFVDDYRRATRHARRAVDVLFDQP